MLNLLHTYYKPLCLILLVLLGLAFGHLASSMLQIKLRPRLTGTLPAGHPPEAQTPRISRPDLNLVLRRNVFDADGRSATARIDPEAAATETAAPAEPVLPPDLKLIGTVVAGADSLALIQSGEELQVFRLEDELQGGGIIEEIGRNRVAIRTRDQRLATLLLYTEEKDSSPRRPPPSPTPAAATRPDQAPAEDGLTGTVREVGENRWVVSSDMVESVRENFAAQLRLAQMQPNLVDGRTEGFFIRRINPRSVLAKMGLQRGDVVVDVNNIKLDSPEKALQIFQQLREARQITVSVKRSGQPLSFVYEIQ